jgi:hypothetical protein
VEVYGSEREKGFSTGFVIGSGSVSCSGSDKYPLVILSHDSGNIT